MTRYEYRVVEIIDDKYLNQLGFAGFRLVSTIPAVGETPTKLIFMKDYQA